MNFQDDKVKYRPLQQQMCDQCVTEVCNAHPTVAPVQLAFIKSAFTAPYLSVGVFRK